MIDKVVIEYVGDECKAKNISVLCDIYNSQFLNLFNSADTVLTKLIY